MEEESSQNVRLIQTNSRLRSTDWLMTHTQGRSGRLQQATRFPRSLRNKSACGASIIGRSPRESFVHSRSSSRSTGSVSINSYNMNESMNAINCAPPSTIDDVPHDNCPGEKMTAHVWMYVCTCMYFVAQDTHRSTHVAVDVACSPL